MAEPLLFAIEEIPRPKGKRTHGPKMGTVHRGEEVWQCGNALCGACAAAFHTEVGADLCDFRAPTGERCRYTANHGRPLNPPPEIPTHVCIRPFTVEAFPCQFCEGRHPFKTDANNVLCPELRP